jgi:hypothetical protein
MPFTLAHPAAVLPLRRFRFLQTVPLIIGSMVPDAHYFLPERWQRYFLVATHTFEGTFTLCLPMGMAALLMILLLRDPLTVLLPGRIRWVCLHSLERFSAPPMHWPIAVLSILVGSWTHLAWDSFTHPGGWLTERVTALRETVSIFGWQTEMSHLLQYVSSIAGLTVLGMWFARLWARAPGPASFASWPVSHRVLVGAIVAGSVGFGLLHSLYALYAGSYYRMLFILLTRSIRWSVLLLLLAGMVVVLSRRPALQTVR